MSTINQDKIEAIRKIALIRALANSPVQTPQGKTQEDELLSMDDPHFTPKRK